MNYIELSGVSGSGKSFLKKKIEKEKKNIYNAKKFIIDYFLASRNRSFYERIASYLVIIYFSNFFEFFKSFLRPKRIIRKNNNKIIFVKSGSKNYLNLMSFIKISSYYENILKKLSVEFKFKNKELYKVIKKEILKTRQSLLFKNKIHLWFLENLLILEISKLKKNNGHIILDEGLIHRIYILFSISKNKNQFLKQVFKFYKQIGKIYFIEISLDKLLKNLSLRNKKNQGFLYNDKKEMIREIKNYNSYVNKVKNKIEFKRIRK